MMLFKMQNVEITRHVHFLVACPSAENNVPLNR